MHMNIVNMQGINTRIGSNPPAVGQFQLSATPETKTAPEKRYSDMR